MKEDRFKTSAKGAPPYLVWWRAFGASKGYIEL